MGSDNSYVKEPKKKRSDGKTPAQRTAQAKKAWDTMRKKNAREDSERGYKINPILDIILKNKKEKWVTENNPLFTQYNKIVEEWRPKLLGKRDPWIKTEKLAELFDMYDFSVSKPEREDFFSFKISPGLAHGKSQQHIFVIEKLYEKIMKMDIDILIEKLQNHKVIIITISNDNPLDFSYDTDKICLIDKELLEWLLLYRIDKITKHGMYTLIKEKGKM